MTLYSKCFFSIWISKPFLSAEDVHSYPWVQSAASVPDLSCCHFMVLLLFISKVMFILWIVLLLSCHPSSSRLNAPSGVCATGITVCDLVFLFCVCAFRLDQQSFRLRWCSTDALFTDLCFGFCPPLLLSPLPASYLPSYAPPIIFFFFPLDPFLFLHIFNATFLSWTPPMYLYLQFIYFLKIIYFLYFFSFNFWIWCKSVFLVLLFFNPCSPTPPPLSLLHPSSSWKPPSPPSSNAGRSDLYLRLSSSSSAPPLPVLCSAVSLSKDGHASKSLYPLRYVQPLLFYLYSLC